MDTILLKKKTCEACSLIGLDHTIAILESNWTPKEMELLDHGLYFHYIRAFT